MVGVWESVAYIKHFILFQTRQCADIRVFLTAESLCPLPVLAWPSPGPGLCSAPEMLLYSAVRQVRNKHHAASAVVIIVINQNYPPSRGRAWACNDCNAGLITRLQWEAQSEANNDNEASSILWVAALVIYFSGSFWNIPGINSPLGIGWLSISPQSREKVQFFTSCLRSLIIKNTANTASPLRSLSTNWMGWARRRAE